MGRTYKMEYVNKVKEKFNDAQPIKQPAISATPKSCDDKNGKERKAVGVAKRGS